MIRGKLAEGIARTKAAIELDPTDAENFGHLAVALQKQGDTEGVIRAADRCLELAPQATFCLETRIEQYDYAGRCAEAERDARRIIKINPGDSYGYLEFAQARLTSAQSVDGAIEALRPLWIHSVAEADWDEAASHTELAMVTGDKASLTRWLEALKRLAEGRAGYKHVEATWYGANALAEFGAGDRAADLAADYLERRGVWETDDLREVAWDIVPEMSKVVARAGRISQDEFARRRDHWIAGWRPRILQRDTGSLWIYGYAETVDTPQEALEALEKLPEYLPLPAYRPNFIADAAIGHTYLLAGQPSEAIPLLQLASSRCDPFEEPYAYVRSSLWLGEALEAVGRKDEACASYQRVIQQWGGFGPRSVTLREARARSTALACSGQR